MINGTVWFCWHIIIFLETKRQGTGCITGNKLLTNTWDLLCGLTILLALCEGNPPMDSFHKWPVMQKTFAYQEVIMYDLKVEHYSNALQMPQHFWQLIKKLIERAATISRTIYMPDSCQRCHWHGNRHITAAFTRKVGYIKLGKMFRLISHLLIVKVFNCYTAYPKTHS